MKQRTELVLSQNDYQQLRRHLLGGPEEQMAFALANPSQSNDRLQLVLQEIIPVPSLGLSGQTAGSCEARDDFVRPILVRCKREGRSLIHFHSHPFSASHVGFSSIDDDGDWERFIFLAGKMPSAYHASVVMGGDSIAARMWCREYEAVVPLHGMRVIGAPVQLIASANGAPRAEAYRRLVEQGCLKDDVRPYNWDLFSRQVLAFEQQGQARLRQSTVAIVGVGGIGSIVAITLAHLGVGHLLLIDHDVLELTNLNRWLGGRAAQAQASTPKVEACRAYISELNPGIEVEARQASVFDPQALSALKTADAVVGCTDTEATRLLLNRFAVQYLMPYVDCAAGIEASDGRIDSAGGQVRVVLPDGPCLECMEGIDRQQAALELLSPGDRGRRTQAGYVTGEHVAAPSVMPLNETIASLAATEAMNVMLGFKPPAAYIFYDLLQANTRRIEVTKRAACPSCSPGAFARLADSEPLPLPSGDSDAPIPPPVAQPQKEEETNVRDTAQSQLAAPGGRLRGARGLLTFLSHRR